MPRLGLGYDMDQFLDHCRMTKPPYECPHASCGKIYRSLAGIQHHMNTYDHENPPPNVVTPKSARKKNMKRPPSPVASQDPEPPSIPYSHDMKTVEFEVDGKLTRLSVYDPIEILSKHDFPFCDQEDYEASMPPVVEEPPPQEQARTPTIKPLPKTPTSKTSLSKTPVQKTPLQKPPKARTGDKDRGVDVQRYTIEEKKSNKLPEASFSVIEDYYKNLPDAPPQPSNYHRFIEKSLEELDEEVEYDMDEEDRAWLQKMNEKRAVDELPPVEMETFELLMDRLEKESFFQAQSTGRDSGVPIDEDAVCCICMDGECQNSNVILFCDMCNLAVHQECYGVPYIPEGQWLCRRCLQSPSRAVDCALCPNKGGAFKQTDDARWAHVVCAMWIPEVCFANTVFLEPIDSIGNIPPARWKLTCYICKQRGVGACIQCNKVNCYTAFHVTCAQQAGLHMKIDAVRETSVNGTSVTVRKAAYCDMHTPADSDALDEIMDSAKKAAAKAASRQKMKKARKILAEKRSAAPIVSVPTIPADRPILPTYCGVVNSVPILPSENIQKLASLVSMPKRSQFMHRLLAFWTLKRQSRNGVPLLRRLTTSHSRRSNRSPEEKNTDYKDKEKILSEAERRREEIKYWQRLRQDLEKARLLCELIRKREKTKRELVKAKAEEKQVQLAPLVHLLLQTIDIIQEKDQQMIFAEPVDFDEVLDYLDVVKHPMDLSTMRQKAETHQYRTIDQFASDFELMIDNCLTYNAKETIFYRTAVKLRDQGGAIIRQLRRNVENIGFDMETGLLLPHRPKPLPEYSDNKIIKEVDDALVADGDDSASLEDREKALLELLDKANMIRHHVARIKRVKLIRREIGIVRRKLAMNHSGNSHYKASVTYYDSDDDSDKDDSDIDNSSVIDDEAEPGEPSRPSTPPPLAAKMVNVHLSHTPKTPLSNRKVPLSSSPMTTPVQRGRQRKTGFRGTPKDDTKQKRIDSFFERINKNSQRESDHPDHAATLADESKATKPEKEDSAQETPKKRGPGRPPKRLRTLSGPSASPPAKKQVESDSAEPVTPTKESSEDGPEEEPPSVPSSPSGVNRRTSVLFTKKAGALFKKPDSSSPQKRISRQRRASESTQGTNSDVDIQSPEKTPKSANKKKGHLMNTGLTNGVSVDSGVICHQNTKSGSSLSFPENISILDLSDSGTPPSKDSFKMYRQGGEIPPETDEDTHSESNSSLTDTEDDTASDSDSEGVGSESDSSVAVDSPGSGHTGDQIPLEPLDLVWAKCRGYPWYPALIINPKMPKTGYFHNGVPIPVPPDDVLALANNYPSPMYLVLFFDNKRTWQWLPRNKLEPLGVDSTLDKAKLVESRKPAERKAVKKAYEKAILHRCRVTGENTGLSGESENEEAS
ncbi:bromodomain and PHD finger-containing protein 3-like isoform X5 [Penaeus monodon]|uniref:bromodomain and PHD finger-containing protein 3-like isoform X5 n=1 Tax=Penaeus monodon TaxID=6687 RepID=UPI0018A755BD|nr:bromodomain and PHD finger-containing protein 3-like isoform X5 [Penaeus monodon]